MELTCPKCHGTMRTYERNSVVIDQCADCRGVFLDRGELEKLIDAEARWADAPPAGQQPNPYQQTQPYQQAYQQQGYGQQGHGPQQGYGQPYREQYYRKHKRRSFLDDLFD